MARSQARIGKGSQEVCKSITERLIRSVLNPNEGMYFVTPANGIPCGELAMRIGSGWLGDWHRARMENDPCLPPPYPCTEGYLTQFFPHFFNHKE